MRKIPFGMGLLCALLMTHDLRAQLVVNNTLTPEDLVQNVLLGGGVTVSNVTFNGLPGNLATIQAGSFDGTNCNVGMNEGLVLASGDVNIAVGPNNDGGATLPLGGMNLPGDPDLTQALGGGFTTNDAAVLEFDFVPDGDSLSFNYVFGSEEYLEWVNSSFNDVFGFFLSGPGITGPYLNNAINIALVPGTNLPVSIDNVNNVMNPAYYVDNGDGFTPPYNNDPQYIQFDGFTTVLTARALVQCGQTYHIKIAVADAGDNILDSGVFIEAGSFSSPNAIELEIVTASSDGTMTEGCTDATFTISRPGDNDDVDVTVTISGTATNGVDYTQIPVVITIPDGQNSVSFPISAFEDGLAEGMEEILLTASYVNICGDTSISTVSVPILDYVPINAMVTDLALDCTQDSVLTTVMASGGFGDLDFLWSTGSTSASTWVPGLIDGSYEVVITDACERSVTEVVNVSSGCAIIIPNVFSPNGDGQNDLFVISGIEGTNNTLRIFNRWGMVIYETRNYRNQWDGRDTPDGTYYYELLVDGDDQPHTGHVTILKTK